MNKILSVIFVFLILQGLAFADEIINSKGDILSCKIVTVTDGLIEYEKNGCLYSFTRSFNQPVFNDYIDVRVKLGKNQVVQRISGKIYFKDFGGVKIKTQNEELQVPWYRVKFVGIYNPN